MKTSSNRTKTRGEGLVIVVILVAIIGAGVWWLFSIKKESDKEARAFGRELIERLAVNKDQAFFADHLGPQAKMDYPPSQQAYLISKLKELGTPALPIQID